MYSVKRYKNKKIKVFVYTFPNDLDVREKMLRNYAKKNKIGKIFKLYKNNVTIL